MTCTLLLLLCFHVQDSLSCSLHCCNYIFTLVMCTYRNISGWSDINTKIYEQCGMDVTEWLWIGIGLCWCSQASTRGGKTTCTWFWTYNQQVETGHAGIRCRSQKNETRHWGVTSQIFNLECYTLGHHAYHIFLAFSDPRKFHATQGPSERVGSFIIFIFGISQILKIGSFGFI